MHLLPYPEILHLSELCFIICKKGVVSEDPSENLRAPRIEKKMPEILTVQEVDRLLSQPNPHTGKGIRDKAMMELLYATGMRVSELLALKTEDVNLSFGYVICHDNGKERVIPIGNVSRDMLQKYMDEARDFFVKNQREPALFTNCSGKPMSRQGTGRYLRDMRRAPESKRILRLIRFGTHLQSICCKMEQISKAYRKCLAIRIFLLPRCIWDWIL